MNLLKYVEPMKNLPDRFSNLAFWRGCRKFKDSVVNALEYMDSWGESVENDIVGLQAFRGTEVGGTQYYDLHTTDIGDIKHCTLLKKDNSPSSINFSKTDIIEIICFGMLVHVNGQPRNIYYTERYAIGKNGVSALLPDSISFDARATDTIELIPVVVMYHH